LLSKTFHVLPLFTEYLVLQPLILAITLLLVLLSLLMLIAADSFEMLSSTGCLCHFNIIAICFFFKFMFLHLYYPIVS